MNRLIFIFFAFLIAASSSYAQNTTVAGPKKHTLSVKGAKKHNDNGNVAKRNSRNNKKAKDGDNLSTQVQIPILSLPYSTNGVGYVDLGLSVQWATCNIGASSPEGSGYYYAWGELVPKTNYSVDNSNTYGVSQENLQHLGIIDNNNKLAVSHDVAHTQNGNRFRMPTFEELKELESQCKWERGTINGVRGYKVTGPSGNSIFLPASGCYLDNEISGIGQDGFYWSSNANSYQGNNGNYQFSWCLQFELKGNTIAGDMTNYRYLGFTIRAVVPKTF